MGCNSFTFKQFAVDQTDCAMKVGTDGVLLGAWVDLNPAIDKVLLDIGTGTGVIALMLAQRTAKWNRNARIEAIEIDEKSAQTAHKNFTNSPWVNRLIVNAMPLQEFALTHRTFNHIVSNPPFFVNSLQAPDPARSAARHATELTYEELISLSTKLLDPGNGRISLIVPAGTETEKIVKLAIVHGLTVSRLTEVYSTPNGAPKRTLLEFSCKNRQVSDGKKAQEPEIRKLTIDSPEYRLLTRDFYLKF